MREIVNKIKRYIFHPQDEEENVAGLLIIQIAAIVSILLCLVAYGYFYG